MTCPHCTGASKVFNGRTARRESKRYARKGPRKTTRWLFEMIRARGVAGRTLLDVGGGVGVVQHEFAAAGGKAVVDVDASPAYLAAARAEAERRGYAGRATYVEGDFVEVADQVPPADFVTLDRVVCCYPDPDALLGRAAERARRGVALVWPRDRLVTRIGRVFANTAMWFMRNPFRTYIHPDTRIEAPLRAQGFQRTEYRTTALWQVAVYVRDGTTADEP